MTTFTAKPDLPAEYVVCDECDEIVPDNEKDEHACDPDEGGDA
jgi:hypothetical protein